ncbi:MAG TPA: DUF4381 domain-containing protein [Janthinobacterium sp.]|nr:DUF4381 domain-containing protein [Janthinobacterium sp.]
MGGMTPDWLAQLAPPHAPGAPGWWPPAPGWWGLLALALLTIAAAVYARRRPRARLRRAALRELALLEAQAGGDADLARKLEHLVRRYAVVRFGRDAVANLSGARWIDFVVAHGGADWAGDSGAALLQAAYGGAVQAQRARWLSGARGFFRART